MAPSSGDQGQLRLDFVLADIQDGGQKQRTEGLKNLRAIFERTHTAANVEMLTDTTYHEIFETVFKVALNEKQSFLTTKGKTTAAAAITRLTSCIDVIRVIIRASASKLRVKTVQAVIDHITQTLPNANGEYCAPISQHYLRALSEVLEHKAHVEHFKKETWLYVVDFCVQGIGRYLVDSGGEQSAISRSSSSQGVNHASRFTPKLSRVSSHSQNQAGAVSRRNVEDLLQCLLSLVSAPNAPLLERAQELVDGVMSFLRSQGSTVSQVHHLAFCVINVVLSFMHTDQISLTQSVAHAAIPVICQLWQGKTVAKDEMLNSVRDEMLILLLSVHLHLERTMKDDQDENLAQALVDLLNVLRAEYARRSGRDRLQLDDLEMADVDACSITMAPFHLNVFQLKAHSARAERGWAILQVIGTLEILVRLSGGDDTNEEADDDDDEFAGDNQRPRKRQRLDESSDRLLDPLESADEGTRLTGLQAIPFILQNYQLSTLTLRKLLGHLGGLVGDKRGHIDSWALLAIASCTHQNVTCEGASADWLQLWQIGSRSLTLATTCRAASLQLHSILAKGLVPYHDIGEDVNAMITSADVNGPAVTCDSAILLMMHLLHVRVTETPGSSMQACRQVIRWMFDKWKFLEQALTTVRVQPHYILDLLRTSLGLPRLPLPAAWPVPCGPIAQAWQRHLKSQEVLRYLLLLDNTASRSVHCASCPKYSAIDEVSFHLDASQFREARKLILELLVPKCDSLLQIWKSSSPGNSAHISMDTFRGTVDTYLSGLLLAPHFISSPLQQVDALKLNLQSLEHEILRAIQETQETQNFIEALLQQVQPYLPNYGSADMACLSDRNPELLHFFGLISKELDRRRSLTADVSGTADDMMDLDDEFSTQISHARSDNQRVALPRQDGALDLSSFSFNHVTSGRLSLLASINDHPNSLGVVPSEFIDRLIFLPDEELISCRRLLRDILDSDLVVGDADSVRLLNHLGTVLTSKEFERCEVAQGLCVEVLMGLATSWSADDDSSLAETASQIYHWFIHVALPKDIISPNVQTGLAALLLQLQQLNSQYGEALGLPSPRTSLLDILVKGNAPVKFYIGDRLPDIFGRYVLKEHDAIFIDVLESLPEDPNWIEGIAFRLFVISRLGSRWSTLLRRCIYHILEAPGKISGCMKYASRCLVNLSSALNAEGPRELFSLFAPQILFTWLEHESIEAMPYQIFGYTSLKALLEHSQEELTALMMMRGQVNPAEHLAETLGLSLPELLRKCFPKTMAYGVAHDLSVRPPKGEEHRVKCETRIRKSMGNDEFLDCVNKHFPDIIALFFNTVDIAQEASLEKSLRNDDALSYAADIMTGIKDISTSNVVLPTSQQPYFKAKYLKDELSHVCRRTIYQDVTRLYTPALVTSIARMLFNTMHRALGSLHACAVLRKVRVLISLSGASALQGYPLEMLLQSIRPFITDPECADDAIGIMRYLLDHGQGHLEKSPSFIAGIALSTLGPLRMFLKSSQSTTTQESQYRATMTKAQDFHTWFGQYLTEYDSPSLKGSSKVNFHSMLQSAHSVRSVGNAEIDSPESNLLLKLLEDEQMSKGLLSRPSRRLALAMLSSQFQCPASFRNDVLGSDALAIEKAAVVWKSCRDEAVSSQYLSWAARVLGRAFAASGNIHQDLLRESTLRQIKELSTSTKVIDSRVCILGLVQALTLGNGQRAIGLAESALRIIVSGSDESDLEICQQSLSKSLCSASVWKPYQIPPSDISPRRNYDGNENASFATDAIVRSHWLRDLSIRLVRFVEDDVILSALEPILLEVVGFADQAFPFILHHVLSAQFEGQQTAKRQLSDALANWFGTSDHIDKNNMKLLINSILYLRTQPLPQERSSADRARWLDIDYIKAATAAAKCGMFKTALLFVEEHHSTPIKSSRRSSSTRGETETTEMPTELLLKIFKSIDDPDLYYGVQQAASLRTILSRLEYEKDGQRSLAFRGAQYDSHLRRQAPESAQDAQSLVKALDVLSLSGLSHSLLQSQQTVGMDSASLESMFRTARKLEQWDIPVPSTCNNNAVTIYKAFQAVHTAADHTSILKAVNEGFCNTMNGLVREDLSANALRDSLQSLAILTELDETFSTRGSEQFEGMLSTFKSRSDWMKTGRFDDISQILSCRGTTLSTLSQQPRLRDITGIRPDDTRLVEVQTTLLSSSLNRAHNALQESLSLATSLMDLIKPCHDVGLSIEAATHLEAANALWDQGEMASSIGMLQALDQDPSLKKQTIPIGRSELLSKIGHQVSVARLEKPDRIIQNYLEPALKELKGKNNGSEAGEVFHQFAVFCDQQLEDPDSLEDLKRLEKLSQMKQTEVDDLARLIKNSTSHDQKTRYKGASMKAKQWLKLDREELHRQNSNRDEFLRQSLENYLLALAAYDDHDNNALRFSALWLQHSEKPLANQAVSRYLSSVPSRKFTSLMNQLTSRLLDNGAEFQKLLFDLVFRICTDHPYHGMYHISSGTRTTANSKDDAALSRLKAMKKMDAYLVQSPKVAEIWTSIVNTNKAYCRLAQEKDEARYKNGKKISLKDSQAGSALKNTLTKWHIPPPTMEVDIALDLDYSKVPIMTGLESQMSIASGVSAPKIITALASNGNCYKQLVKGGNDDLRQDAIMEQVFAQVSELLKANTASRQRNLSIRTYKVLPLTSSTGVIEFVQNTIPLHDYVMPAHERIYPKDLKASQCRKEISEAQTKSLEVRVARFRGVTEKFHPVMRYFFLEKFDDPDEWFVKRLAYTRSTAAISILGHVLGLGDRHGHNILLDSQSGEVVHIDLGVAFEMGRVLPVPELVPFRLTRDIVDGMGITKTEGVFRRCCEFTLEALRENVYSISTILDVLRYDPLYSWSISPVRLAKLQDAQSAAPEPVPTMQGEVARERTKDVVNEPSEADRALEVVNKKLSKTLSVTATVNDLINQASDERHLAVLYSGWAAYA